MCASDFLKKGSIFVTVATVAHISFATNHLEKWAPKKAISN